MSISPHSRIRRGLVKTAWVYAAVSAFCGLFGAVYLHLSHGETSLFMALLFAPPLLLGTLPALGTGLLAKRAPSRAARRLWNSGVATLTAGFLVRAVVELSGRYTTYDRIYWIAASALFLAAVAGCLGRGAEAGRAANRLGSN